MISALVLAAVAAAAPPQAATVQAVRLQHLNAVAAQYSARRSSGAIGTQPESIRRALASALNHSMQKATALKLLRTTVAPRPPVAKHNKVHGDENAQGNLDAPTDPSPVAQDSSKSVRITAAPPQSGAVERICGNEATICSAWWPTALGDTAQYKSCMQQPDKPEENFGQTRAEYCGMTFGGDCDGVSPQGTSADLCSLVHGMGVRWQSFDQFGDFVTWGDCTHFAQVEDLPNNLAGLGVDLAAAPPSDTSMGTADESSVSICAGTLYLLAPG